MWSSGKAFVSRAGLGTTLPTARHCCNISLKEAVIMLLEAMTQRWAPQTLYTLRHNTANTKKDLINLVTVLSGF